MRLHGSPGGGVLNGLVSLLRWLQRDGGEPWAQGIGGCISAVLSQVTSANEAIRTSTSAPELLLALGALSVVGGHVEALHAGGRAQYIADNHPSNALVVAVDRTSLFLVADACDLPEVQEVDAGSAIAAAEVEPCLFGLDLQRISGMLISMLSLQSPISPMLAMLQARTVRAVYALLAGDGGEHAASAVLGAKDALPLLLKMAVDVAPKYEAATPVGSRPQVRSADELALLADIALVDVAPTVEHVQLAIPYEHFWQPSLRLGVDLPEDLQEEEKVVQLVGMGFPIRQCDEALRVCEGDLPAATARLLSADQTDADHGETLENREKMMCESLLGMGFPSELAELALKRSGYDLQRAADLLLEGRLDVGQLHDQASAGASSSAAVGEEGSSAPLAAGDTIDVSDECGFWHRAEVVESDTQSLLVHYVGWCAEWDEWLSRSTPRIRRHTGTATNGPGALRSIPSEQRRSRASKPSTGSATQAGNEPSGLSRSRWFWRQSQGSSSKRRASSPEKAALAESICPSAEADFFSADAGITRVVQRVSNDPEFDDWASSGQLQPRAGPARTPTEIYNNKNIAVITRE